jgi:uncharacterized protein (TIGR00251 family)
MAGWLTRHATGARATVKGTPRASRNGVKGVAVDSAGQPHLAVRVSAPPEAGKANAALIKVLARRWRMPQGDLEVVSGAGARRKVLQIRGSPDVLIARIEAIERATESAAGHT